MPNQAVAELIGRELGDLPHPDPTSPRVKVAGYSTLGKPPQLVAQLAPQATRVGEGVVHLLETNGYAIIAAADLAVLRDNAAIGVALPTPIATVRCNGGCTDPKDRQPGVRLLFLNISHPDRVQTSGETLIKYLANRDPSCARNHRFLS